MADAPPAATPAVTPAAPKTANAGKPANAPKGANAAKPVNAPKGANAAKPVNASKNTAKPANPTAPPPENPFLKEVKDILGALVKQVQENKECDALREASEKLITAADKLPSDVKNSDTRPLAATLKKNVIPGVTKACSKKNGKTNTKASVKPSGEAAPTPTAEGTASSKEGAAKVNEGAAKAAEGSAAAEGAAKPANAPVKGGGRRRHKRKTRKHKKSSRKTKSRRRM